MYIPRYVNSYYIAFLKLINKHLKKTLRSKNERIVTLMISSNGGKKDVMKQHGKSIRSKLLDWKVIVLEKLLLQKHLDLITVVKKDVCDLLHL